MRGFFSTEMRRACAPDAMHRGGQSAALDPRPFRLSAIGYRLRSMTEARATAQVRSKTARKSPLLLGLQNACTPADVKETLG
ncbi:hypothetical protein DXO246_10085 [Xanthomonas oryzae pv. oryzae]|nr:hypothetical protein AZ54_06770 [Xanthomonas oryzae pv. oryzae PXO86]AKO03689.1 hypothetical protein ACU16_05460 [Xanthomonas oryzae pv. oryzicola]ALZ71177.1 hypothetical protein APZ20_06350 [Xanthomonas oryzae pv. oryzae]AOS06822.1 hypothetical protein ATY43_12960 [Xanthomonas oryzae pv. oryzae]AOS14173.1 hypothetical protein ATY45_06185 [Xanthomonas oryzae pv. oryzae]